MRQPTNGDATEARGFRRDREPIHSLGVAPLHELSPRAIRCLLDLGMSSSASLRDIAAMVPALHLAATLPGEPGFNAQFRMGQCDRTVVREIQHWLLRHGLSVQT